MKSYRLQIFTAILPQHFAKKDSMHQFSDAGASHTAKLPQQNWHFILPYFVLCFKIGNNRTQSSSTFSMCQSPCKSRFWQINSTCIFDIVAQLLELSILIELTGLPVLLYFYYRLLSSHQKTK